LAAYAFTCNLEPETPEGLHMSRCAETMTVVLVALYRYQNFPIRILHALLEKIDSVEPHTILFKN